jgi:hypothetical protein
MTSNNDVHGVEWHTVGNMNNVNDGGGQEGADRGSIGGNPAQVDNENCKNGS